jgi:hypothetical protein
MTRADRVGSMNPDRCDPSAAIGSLSVPDVDTTQGELAALGDAGFTLQAILATGAPMTEALGLLAKGYVPSVVARIAEPWLRETLGTLAGVATAEGDVPDVWFRLQALNEVAGGGTAQAAVDLLGAGLSHTSALKLMGSDGGVLDWLRRLPDGLAVDGRLALRKLKALEAIPEGLKLGVVRPDAGVRPLWCRTLLISECGQLAHFPADLADRVDVLVLAAFGNQGFAFAEAPLRGLAAIGFPKAQIEFWLSQGGERLDDPPPSLQTLMVELFPEVPHGA